MTASEIEVYSHDTPEPRRAGTLRPSFAGGTLAGASFEYHTEFIATGGRKVRVCTL